MRGTQVSWVTSVGTGEADRRRFDTRARSPDTEVFAALAAMGRVARALVGSGSLAQLAERPSARCARPYVSSWSRSTCRRQRSGPVSDVSSHRRARGPRCEHATRCPSTMRRGGSLAAGAARRPVPRGGELARGEPVRATAASLIIVPLVSRCAWVGVAVAAAGVRCRSTVCPQPADPARRPALGRASRPLGYDRSCRPPRSSASVCGWQQRSTTGSRRTSHLHARAGGAGDPSRLSSRGRASSGCGKR